MKTNGAGILALVALLAACSKCPDGRMAGNSAGCGNPIKTAELQTIPQVPCENSGTCTAAWPWTPYTVAFGESLSVKPRFSTEFIADSIRGSLYLFEGDQIPVFNRTPVDSVLLRNGAFTLTPQNLARLRKRGGGDSSYSAFSGYARLSFYVNHQVFPQASLLAGLVFDWNFGSFSYSDHNPLAESGSALRIAVENGNYRGTLDIPDSLLIGNRSFYVYVPGSPFFTTVDQGDRKLLLDSLPLGEAYELRFFARPNTNQPGALTPVYRLVPESEVGSNRMFGLSELNEALSLP